MNEKLSCVVVNVNTGRVLGVMGWRSAFHTAKSAADQTRSPHLVLVGHAQNPDDPLHIVEAGHDPLGFGITDPKLVIPNKTQD